MSATAPCLVRAARADDWTTVTALMEGLGRPSILAGKDAGHHRDLFGVYLASADASALVGEVNGVVVGFVNVEYRQRLNHSTPQAWIPDLVVEESHRGRGVGRALLARVEELAPQHQAGAGCPRRGPEMAAAVCAEHGERMLAKHLVSSARLLSAARDGRGSRDDRHVKRPAVERKV